MRSLICLLLALASAHGETIPLRLTHGAGQELKLEVAKTGLMSGKRHIFVFPRFDGQLDFDPAEPARSRVVLRIDARALELRDDWLSPKDAGKVRNFALNEMLAVGKYPTLTFESTGLEHTAAGQFKAAGKLTVRGVSRDVIVDITSFSATALRIEGRSAFKMTGFGLKPPGAALGAIGTRDEMVFTFRLSARKP